MKIKTNLYWIIAILLKSNLLTICEGDSDIDHEPILDHFDHLDHFHDIDGPVSKYHESTTQFQTNNLRQGSLENQILNKNVDNNNEVIHSDELDQHNGDSFTKYETTTHTNQEINNELYNMVPSIQQSNVPGSFTKVVKTTVIKQSNNNGNNSPETTSSMKDISSINKLKKNGIGNSMSKSQTLSQTDHMDQMNRMGPMDHMDQMDRMGPMDHMDQMDLVDHTEQMNHMDQMNQMDHMENIGLPSISSQQSSDIQGNLKSAMHTTMTKITISGSPSNELNESYGRMHSMNPLPTNHVISKISSTNSNYNDEITGSGSSQPNLMGCNRKIKKMSMTTDGNGFNSGGSNRRTKTIIIKQHSIDDKNGRSGLDKSDIGFDTENKSSNNIVSSMTTPLEYNQITTTTVDRDSANKFDVTGNSIFDTSNNGYNADLDHDNGNFKGNFKNKYNGQIMSSNKLMGGSYMTNDEYKSSGNCMKKKKKKNGHPKMFKGGNQKNISHGTRKRNGQKRVKNGRNSKNTRSSKKIKGVSQYDSSNTYVREQSKSFSSSDSSSDESSMNNGKKPCCCNRGRKLNKRDSSESNENSHEHHGSDSHYLGNSMQSIGNFMTALPSQPPFMEHGPPRLPFMGLGPPPHMGHGPPPHMGHGPPPHMGHGPPPHMGHGPPTKFLFDMIHGQRPDQSLNYSQSDKTTVFNGQDEMRSQQINDQQFSKIDELNQHLTNQIPNTDSLYKSAFQQQQYFGPQANSLGGDYQQYFEQNRQPPPTKSPYSYSFNQDNYSDLSKMGQTTSEFTGIQSEHENQENINTEFPPMQQDSDNKVIELKQMGTQNSGSVTTHIQSNIISNRNVGPIIEYVKTIKTTGNIDGTQDKHVVQTQSVSPEVDDNGNYI